MQIEEAVRSHKYPEFLTLDELEASSTRLIEEFPDLVEREIIGYSREGRPIEMLKIGRGSKFALWAGVPHPNEPLGTWTAEAMCRYACENPEFLEELDTTLLVIKVADPDGYELNKGWFKGPDFRHPLEYLLNFYRPTAAEQVEWGLADQILQSSSPEAAALAGVLDRYKPYFYYPLHNSVMGGGFFYISRSLEEIAGLYPKLLARNNLPIYWNENAGHDYHLRQFTEGVYELLTVSDARKSGGHTGGGKSTAEFLTERVSNAGIVVCEAPNLSIRTLADRRPSGMARREAMREGNEKALGLLAFMAAQLEALRPSLTRRVTDGRLYRSAKWFAHDAGAEMLDEQRQRLRDANYGPEEATNADVAMERWTPAFITASFMGQLYRVAQEAGAPDRANAIRQRLAAFVLELDSDCGLWVPPAGDLVAVQAGAGVASMAHARIRRRNP